MGKTQEIGRLPAPNSVAAKVLDSLLTHEYMTTEAIAEKAGVKKNSVPPTIASLRKRGLVESTKVKGAASGRKLKHRRLKQPALVPQEPFRKVGKKSKRKQASKTLEAQILHEFAALERSFNKVRDLMTDMREALKREVKKEIRASFNGVLED